MDLLQFTFQETYKNGIEIFFDFDITEGKERKRKTFDGYTSLLFFSENEGKKLYITKTKTDNFIEEGSNLILNLDKYQNFYKSIGANAKNRAQAFFARELKHYSDEEKKGIIINSTESEVLDRIKLFDSSQLGEFLGKLKNLPEMNDISLKDTEISDIAFLDAYSERIKNPNKQNIIVSEYPRIQIEILENHKDFLEKNLDKNETFIQDWIDGKIDNDGIIMDQGESEIKRIRQSRCLIFGLEFISHKSQGELSRKRFDILTRLSEDENEHVIIELKSPCEDVFKIKEVDNINGGRSTEYHLSKDLSRSIPQISHYRNSLENKPDTDDDFQRIGISKGKVVKSIIILGTRKKDDLIWEENFTSLQKNFSHGLEIITYSDLIKKLDTTIKNLKENLK